MNVLFIPHLMVHDMDGVMARLLISVGFFLLVVIASLFDLKTGINASKRLGVYKTSSYGIRKTISKDKDYGVFFFMFFMMDIPLSYFIDFPVLCAICAMAEISIELWSVRETMQKGRDEVQLNVIDKMGELIKAIGEDKAKEVFDIIIKKQ